MNEHEGYQTQTGTPVGATVPRCLGEAHVIIRISPRIPEFNLGANRRITGNLQFSNSSKLDKELQPRIRKRRRQCEKSKVLMFWHRSWPGLPPSRDTAFYNLRLAKRVTGIHRDKIHWVFLKPKELNVSQQMSPDNKKHVPIQFSSNSGIL